MSVSLTVSYGSFFFFRWRYQSVLSEREFDGGVNLRSTGEMVVEIGNFTAGLEPEE